MLKRMLVSAIQLIEWYKDPSKFFEAITGLKPTSKQKEILLRLPDSSFRRAIICAAAGTGKTRLLSVIGLWHVIVYAKIIKKPMEVAIIGGSQRQSQLLYDYMAEYLKLDFISEEVAGLPLKSVTHYKDGSKVVALPASERAVRSIHPDILLLDEAVAAEKIIYSAIPRLTKADSRLIVSSTPHVFLSIFVEMWSDRVKYSMYERYHWTYKDREWIAQEELERGLKEAQSFGEEMVQTEWEGNPYTATGVRFNVKALRELCRVDYKPIKRGLGSIIGGLDWGFHHPTVLSIVEEISGCFYHLGSWSWEEESPSKVAEDIIALYAEHGISVIYADSSHIQENLRLREKGLNIKEIVFRNEKEWLVANQASLIEQGRIKIWEGESVLLQQLAGYVPETKRNDDYVDSLMLAVRRVGIQPTKWDWYIK